MAAKMSIERLEYFLHQNRITPGDPVLEPDYYVRIPACWAISTTWSIKAIIAGQLSYYGGIWTIRIPPPVPKVVNPINIVVSRGRQWIFLPVPRSCLPAGDLNRTYFTSDPDCVEDERHFDPKNCVEGLSTDDDMMTAYGNMESICRIADSANYRTVVQAGVSSLAKVQENATRRSSRLPLPADLSARARWYSDVAKLGAADVIADPNFMLRTVTVAQLGVPRNVCSNNGSFVLLPFPVHDVISERRQRTANEIYRFLAANAAAFKGLPEDAAARGLAARYHVANAGLIFTDIEEDRQWTEIPDVQCEATCDAICSAMGADKAFIEAAEVYVESELFRRHSLTLASIKYIMWRQHNHTSGGSVVIDLPRRMLSAFGWQQDTNMWAGNRELAEQWTMAYFRAFEPVNPHLASVWLQKNRCESWAKICTKYGAPDTAPPLPSVLQRLLGAEIGVAGTKKVTDVMAGLVVMQGKMVLPALQGYSQLPALCAKFEEAKFNGVLAGICQGWWTKHADNGLKPCEFSQNESSIAAVCTDVASYIIDGIKHRKLRQSEALRSLVNNASPGRGRWWRDFVHVGKELTPAQTVALCAKIQRRLGIEPSANLVSEDEGIRTAAFQTLEGIVAYIAGTHECTTPAKYHPIDASDLEAVRTLAITLAASAIEANKDE